MTRFQRVISMSFFVAFLLGMDTVAYAESDWQKAKNEFSEEFQEFKKDGLSAKEVEQLTQKLLDAAGDDIEGTGLKALLETMNQQPERAARMLDEKADVEKLVDVVSTTSALVNADDPIDEMVAVYDSTADAMRDLADGAKMLPGGNRVAPLLDATATQLEIGKTSIKTIAAHAKARNDAINSYDSWVYGESNDPSPTSRLELEFEETPTEEEIEREKLREDEVAQNEACIDQCREQYRAYNDIATKRARARDAAAATSKALASARSTMKSKRLNHNDYTKRLNSYLERYRKKLAKRDAEKARMLRAQRENRLEAYEGYKQLVSQIDESLTRFRINIRDDFASFKKVQNDYLQTKLDVSKNNSKYKSQVRKYKEADALYRIAIKTYEDCVTKCKNELAALKHSDCVTSASASDRLPGDVWLGKWSGMSKYKYEQKELVWEWWFAVSRSCGKYQIQTHTSGPEKVKILEINATKLDFLFNDELGTHIEISLRDSGTYTGTVTQPHNTSFPRGRVEGRKTNGSR